jgi:SPASM domain peptide maturase of grasp-with-spasm system
MNYPDSSYFLLFANCIPVKGVKRSVIYDIQRNNFEFIPNELYTILTRHLKKTSGEIKELFNREYDEILEEYFDFLIQKEFVINVSELDSGFTKYNAVYDVPNAITNCIIDFDADSKHPLTKIAKQLDELICQSLQLRFYSPISIERLEDFLSSFDDSKLRNIELIVPFDEHFSEKAMEQLGAKFPRLQYIIIYSAEENKTAYVGNNDLKISYVGSSITSESCCGTIHSMFFRTNVQAYNEAKQFNSCLNKKISIDKTGQIRNCPSMQKMFGHIDEHSLQAAVTDPEFKALWGITKDKIHSCKVCEFRYMCSDCRAYVENPDDDYSKPLKCGYDPYTNKWEEWSTHPLKQDAINYYGLGKIVVKEMSTTGA